MISYGLQERLFALRVGQVTIGHGGLIAAAAVVGLGGGFGAVQPQVSSRDALHAGS